MTQHEHTGPIDFDSYVDDPPSAEIAEILNETGSSACPHGYEICVAWCGVKRGRARWVAIKPEAREAWLKRKSFTEWLKLYARKRRESIDEHGSRSSSLLQRLKRAKGRE